MVKSFVKGFQAKMFIPPMEVVELHKHFKGFASIMTQMKWPDKHEG
jgi:hypothetical protein